MQWESFDGARTLPFDIVEGTGVSAPVTHDDILYVHTFSAPGIYAEQPGKPPVRVTETTTEGGALAIDGGQIFWLDGGRVNVAPLSLSTLPVTGKGIAQIDPAYDTLLIAGCGNVMVTAPLVPPLPDDPATTHGTHVLRGSDGSAVRVDENLAGGGVLTCNEAIITPGPNANANSPRMKRMPLTFR